MISYETILTQCSEKARRLFCIPLFSFVRKDGILTQGDAMIKVKELTNGIPVVMEQMDYLSTVSFGVWVRVGSAFETVENNGMSHMLEHMFFKGTEKRSARQLADEMAVIGGNLNACTCKEYTSFYVTTLAEHMPQAAELIGDMLQHAKFDEEDFEREKRVVLEEIMMYADSPEDMVHEMLQKTVWQDHPLGYLISGEAEVVNAFDREALVSFYRKHYVAENMLISVAGKFDEAELLDICQSCFGDVRRGSNRVYLSTPEYHRSFYQDEKDIEQVHLNLGFPGTSVNSELKYALAVAGAVLGGSENSRLFQRIREEMGLTYSIFSYESPYLRTGLSHIDVVLNPLNLELVFDGILDVLQDYRKNGMTEDELVRTKAQLKAELMIGSESTRNRMESNGKAMMYRGEPVPLTETIRRISAVTGEDVIHSVREYYDPERMSISLVGSIPVSGRKYLAGFLRGME